MNKKLVLLSILFVQTNFAAPISQEQCKKIFNKPNLIELKISAGLIPVKLTHWGKEIEIDNDRIGVSLQVIVKRRAEVVDKILSKLLNANVPHPVPALINIYQGEAVTSRRQLQKLTVTESVLLNESEAGEIRLSLQGVDIHGQSVSIIASLGDIFQVGEKSDSIVNRASAGPVEISPDVGRVWLQLNTPNVYSPRLSRPRTYQLVKATDPQVVH